MIKIEGHTFNPDLLTPDSLVLDIGGNRGNFSRQILDRFHCRVICFEPCKAAFCHIEKIIRDPKFKVVNKAVAASSGKRTFYSAQPMNGGNSVIPGNREFGRYPNEEDVYEVDAVSFNEVLSEFDHVDLVKMDCEGAEMEIIEHSSGWEKIGQMTIEFHDFAFKSISIADIDNCIGILKTAGFTARYDHNDPDRDYYFFR